MRDALRAAGETVELHAHHFAPEMSDSEWLVEVGKRQWAVLTEDRHIRDNQVEIEALIASQVACFTLTSANMSGQQMAAAFLAAVPQMKQLLQRFERPFVATVTRTGHVSLIYTRFRLLRKLR